jgi:hypothetical protein
MMKGSNPGSVKIFLFSPKYSDSLWDLPNTTDAEDHLLGLKQPEWVGDHLPPSSAGV